MQIKYINLNNFLSFGNNVTLDLTDVKYPVLVRGVTTSEEKSNGAGKSSLFESVYWALTGKTVRGVKSSEVIRYGQKICSVQVGFTFAGNTIEIKRTYSHAKKMVNISFNGVKESFHDSKQATKRIFDLLNTNPDVLILACFYGKNFATFSRMRPVDRADLIDLVANGAKWEKARTKANFSAKKLNKDILLMDAELDNLNITSIKNDIIESINLIGDLKKANQKKLLGIYEHKISNNKEIDKLTKTIDGLHNFTKEMESLQSIKLKQQNATHQINVLKYENKLIKREFDLTYTNKLSEITANQEKYLKYEKKSQALQKQKNTGICIFCKQKLPIKFDLEKDLNACLDKIKKIGITTKKLDQELTILKSEESKKVDKIVSDNLSNVNKINSSYTGVDSQIADVQNKINIIENTRRKLSQQVSDLKDDLIRNETIENFLKNGDNIAREIKFKESLESKLVKEQDKKCGITQNKKDAIKKLYIAKYWAVGFKDIRYSLFNSTLAIMEELLNTFCHRQGLQFDNIKITGRKERSTGKEVSEVNATLYRDKEKYNINSLSEGEAQRFDLACFLTISTIIEKHLGYCIDFKVMDEPLVGIDFEGRQNIFDIINDMANNKQIFVIDHDANFQDKFTTVLTVKKDETSLVILD